MEEEDKKVEELEEKEEYDFEAVMKANAEKKRKAAESRKKANKKVLKDYRMK